MALYVGAHAGPLHGGDARCRGAPSGVHAELVRPGDQELELHRESPGHDVVHDDARNLVDGADVHDHAHHDAVDAQDGAHQKKSPVGHGNGAHQQVAARVSAQGAIHPW